MANYLNTTLDHVRTLPDVDAVVVHPSIKNLSDLITNPNDPAASSQAQGSQAAAISGANALTTQLNRIAILKTATANLPQVFAVADKARNPGERVTLVGVGDRLDMLEQTPDITTQTAIGTNVLLDKSKLP